MPSSMPLPANGGQNTRRKAARKQPKWTLLNLLTTWMLTDEGKPRIVDPTAGEGADHEEWRALVQRTLVHAGKKIDRGQLAAPWGQLSRRDFLNWCEETLPAEQCPRLFASKQQALDFSKDFDESKRIEISESSEASPEDEGGTPA